ncbi:valine--tRNA ligase [uncultured Mobiluncus sp.]|uniref:valine--tRNA ligase n=1 Tax=uncultured Mobiluncus sp. TaxID=293425 RepID=UPI00288AB6A5|nr:valine--tRNA ligase [uncultured Mobiluncus sp.]
MTERLKAPSVPAKTTLDGIEDKWRKVWADAQTYAFDPDTTREAVYSIDTPPPTVSGSLHVGHVFSYTHTDLVARYQRMRGKNVFYPMGWDDNGLPTERRVQNYFGVRCDPSLPYVPDFTPPYEGGEGKSIKNADQVPISRKNFVELCERLTAQDEKQFEELWRTLGLSIDWSYTMQTIGKPAQKVAQTFFLRNFARGEVYAAEAPGLWDVTFQTAVAQAELEARDYPGSYHSFAFHREDGKGDIVIETTRPELLGACCALIAHPDDERYADMFGTYVTSPGFDVRVPVLAHPEAEIDKGSGIAMCCTFGDLVDVDWWRDLQLPTRVILRKDGRIIPDVPDWITSERGRALYQETAGKTAFSARKAIVEALRESGEMLGDPKPTQRMTNFYEKGDKPLEIVTSRQWYIRNGGQPYARTAGGTDLREELLARGRELDFVPDFMRVRYENWVNGLNTDWLISRQRFFGVPLPLWYPVKDSGETDFDHPILPSEDVLPIDPTTDTPAGFDEAQRGVPGGFVAEVDIMDTWATSSLTPEIYSGFGRDEKLFAATFPMDLRPQGQDIIRTWLFSTVVRSHLEFDALPWRQAAISGWILDPDHKKMSKSKGNVVTPMGLLEKHSSDAVRYWAASARLGTDAAFDEGEMKVGRRLAIKLLNASKFALSMGGDADLVLDPALVTVEVDRSLIATLAEVITSATKAFEEMNHARALEVTESFFWTLCDDYLELVKDRAYGKDPAADSAAVASARTTLALAIDNVVRLLAPFLPFTTEEVWSWYRTGSVHRAAWPSTDGLDSVSGNPQVLRAAGGALSALRKVKSDAKVSQRTPFLHATVTFPEPDVACAEAARADLVAANHVEGKLEFVAGEVESPQVSVAELGEPPAKPAKPKKPTK